MTQRNSYPPQRVLDAALAEAGYTYGDLFGNKSAPRVVLRQHVAYALRHLTLLSLPQITELMRAKRHSSTHARIAVAAENGGDKFVALVRARLEAKS